jgi:hypothetical protein
MLNHESVNLQASLRNPHEAQASVSADCQLLKDETVAPIALS